MREKGGQSGGAAWIWRKDRKAALRLAPAGTAAHEVAYKETDAGKDGNQEDENDKTDRWRHLISRRSEHFRSPLAHSINSPIFRAKPSPEFIHRQAVTEPVC
jgi:hypothetical protein